MRTAEFNGFYGSGKTECIILVAYNRDGSAWYCVQGSQNVNKTYDCIEDNTNVETLSDVDMFTAYDEINDLNTLIEAIEA